MLIDLIGKSIVEVSGLLTTENLFSQLSFQTNFEMFIMFEGVVYSSFFLHAVGIPLAHFPMVCAEISTVEVTLLESSDF